MGQRSRITERGGERAQFQAVPRGESMTRQSEAEATDIRNIMKKYKKTGVITHLNHRAPIVGDFTQADSLHSALIQVENAEKAFMQLPADVRKVAQHSPEELLRQLATEEGRAALQDAGFDTGYEPPESLNVAAEEGGTPESSESGDGS